jgi:hypothetical protein
MHKARDKDFVKTKEGFLFCVINYYHPKDRIIAYRKYIPNKDGLWVSKSKVRYSRSMQTYSIEDLEKNIEELRIEKRYVFKSRVLGIEISAVPWKFVKRHYKTDEGLRRILKLSKLDPLQETLLELIDELSNYISKSNFGITGSILLDIHNPKFSDIDLIIYGKKESLSLKEAFLSKVSSKVLPLPKDIMLKWAKEKITIFPLSLDEVLKIYKRKWNYGYFKGKVFSVHPVRKWNEINERYGDFWYRGLGLARIRFNVEDTNEALFLPHKYKAKNVRFLEGVEVNNLKEVVSNEGFFGNMLKEGELAEAFGKVELVIDKKSKSSYHRLLVGTFEAKRKEYIKPLS